MAITASNFDAALKDFYLKQGVKVLNDKFRLWKWLPEGEGEVSGRQIISYAHLARNNGVTFMPAGSALPPTINEQYNQIIVPFRQVWASLRFNEDVVAQSRNDRGAWERAAAAGMKRMMKNIIQQGNRSAWLDGTGRLAQVKSLSAAGNATPLTLTLNGQGDAVGSIGLNSNAGARYIQKGMVLDAWTNDSTRTRIAMFVTSVVNSVTLNGAQVIIDNSQGGTGTIVAGDFLTLHVPTSTSAADKEPMGMAGIIDDATLVPILHNINRSAGNNTNYQANVINVGASFAAKGQLQVDHLDRAEDLSDEAGDGEGVVWFGHHSSVREYLKLVQPDRRYNSMQYDPGIKQSRKEDNISTSLAHNDIPLVKEKHCPYSTLFLVAKNSVCKYPVANLHWVEADGKVISLVNGQAGVFEAQATMQYNIGVDTEGPNGCSVLRNIATSIDPVNAN